jgi:hypothetical protein
MHKNSEMTCVHQVNEGCCGTQPLTSQRLKQTMHLSGSRDNFHLDVTTTGIRGLDSIFFFFFAFSPFTLVIKNSSTLLAKQKQNSTYWTHRKDQKEKKKDNKNNST